MAKSVFVGRHVAVVVEIDGERIEVRDPRATRMIRAIVRRFPKIATVRFGALTFDFGTPNEKLKVKLTEAERE